MLMEFMAKTIHGKKPLKHRLIPIFNTTDKFLCCLTIFLFVCDKTVFHDGFGIYLPNLTSFFCEFWNLKCMSSSSMWSLCRQVLTKINLKNSGANFRFFFSCLEIQSIILRSFDLYASISSQRYVEFNQFTASQRHSSLRFSSMVIIIIYRPLLHICRGPREIAMPPHIVSDKHCGMNM